MLLKNCGHKLISSSRSLGEGTESRCPKKITLYYINNLPNLTAKDTINTVKELIKVWEKYLPHTYHRLKAHSLQRPSTIE